MELDLDQLHLVGHGASDAASQLSAVGLDDVGKMTLKQLGSILLREGECDDVTLVDGLGSIQTDQGECVGK